MHDPPLAGSSDTSSGRTAPLGEQALFRTIRKQHRVLSVRAGDTAHMGYNPYRKRVTRRSDVLFVGAGLLASFALVVWAFFG